MAKDFKDSQDAATESVTFAMPDVARKAPEAWAIEKGFLKLHDDGSTNYKTHTPWEFFGARVARNWADPARDPNFTITESEFDEAISYVLGVTAG